MENKKEEDSSDSTINGKKLPTELSETDNTTPDALLLSETFRSFLASARNFCIYLENLLPKSDDLSQLELVLLNLLTLYSNGLQLKEISAPSEDIDSDLHESDFKPAFVVIDRSLPFQYYWCVFDPFDFENTEPVCGDIADDLKDIYKDLKSSLTLFDLGTMSAKENALWNFKFDFDNHWGDHCANAIYAIHHFLGKCKRDGAV
jgi:hypothetical protein